MFIWSVLKSSCDLRFFSLIRLITLATAIIYLKCYLLLHIRGNPIDANNLVNACDGHRCTLSEIYISISNFNEYIPYYMACLPLLSLFQLNDESYCMVATLVFNAKVTNRSVTFVRSTEHKNVLPFVHNVLNLS